MTTRAFRALLPALLIPAFAWGQVAPVSKLPQPTVAPDAVKAVPPEAAPTKGAKTVEPAEPKSCASGL